MESIMKGLLKIRKWVWGAKKLPVSIRVNKLTCGRNAGHTFTTAAILLSQQCRN